jgi:hypothetical protein
MDIQEQLRFWFDAISLHERMDLYKHWTDQKIIDSTVHKILNNNGIVNNDFFVNESNTPKTENTKNFDIEGY